MDNFEWASGYLPALRPLLGRLHRERPAHAHADEGRRRCSRSSTKSRSSSSRRRSTRCPPYVSSRRRPARASDGAPCAKERLAHGEPLLRHDADLLHQRRPPPRERVHDDRGRRARALPPRSAATRRASSPAPTSTASRSSASPPSRASTPQAFADEIAAEVPRDLAATSTARFDDFIRTTEPRHKPPASRSSGRTIARTSGDIYLGHYEGLYCVGCEAYYTEKELEQPGNLCPHHKKPVERVKEESYFFRLSKYAGAAARPTTQAHPDFVQPPRPLQRGEELRARRASRTSRVSRTTFQWGIPVPGDPRHVMYVWFDALTNYRTRARPPRTTRASGPTRVHLVGKDILRFHAVYWPAFLLAAGLAAADADLRARLPHLRRAEDVEDAPQHREPGRAGARRISPDGRRRRAALLPDARHLLRAGRRLQHHTTCSSATHSELGNTLGNLLNRVLPVRARALPRGRARRSSSRSSLEAVRGRRRRRRRRRFDELSPTARARRRSVELLARGQRVRRQGRAVGREEEGRRRAPRDDRGARSLEVLEAVSVMVAPVMPDGRAPRCARSSASRRSTGRRSARDRGRFDPPAPRRPGLAVQGGDPIFPRFEKEKRGRARRALLARRPTSTAPQPPSDTVNDRGHRAAEATPRPSRARRGQGDRSPTTTSPSSTSASASSSRPSG